VRFEIGEILIPFDRLTRLFVPGNECGVRHRLGQLGNPDFSRHELFLNGVAVAAPVAAVALWAAPAVPVNRVVSRADPSVAVACRAALIRAACSVSWILLIPVAGAAAGARPAYRTCRRPPNTSCKRWRIWYHAPWFCGSS